MNGQLHLEGETLMDTWRVDRKFDRGGFGETWKVTHVATGMEAVMKTEGVMEEHQLLKLEATILKNLNDERRPHVAKFFGCGSNERFNYLFTSLLGPDLHKLRLQQPNRRFTTSTAARLGIQCVQCIEELHSIGYLHRDIKPHNFAFYPATSSRARILRIFDFGLARKFRNEAGQLRKPRRRVGFRGSYAYASTTTHEHNELARSDDLWSLLYSMIEMFAGRLPWAELSDKSEVGRMKRRISEEDLFRNCPRELFVWHRIIKAMTFSTKPNYEALREQMRDLMRRENIGPDDPFDWEVNRSEASQPPNEPEESESAEPSSVDLGFLDEFDR